MIVTHNTSNIKFQLTGIIIFALSIRDYCSELFIRVHLLGSALVCCERIASTYISLLFTLLIIFA